MDKIKTLLLFALKVLVAIIIINAILSLLGPTAQAAITNPVGFLKGLIKPSSTT
jgi:hypothetical protein